MSIHVKSDDLKLEKEGGKKEVEVGVEMLDNQCGKSLAARVRWMSHEEFPEDHVAENLVPPHFSSSTHV